jgi:hypothetical protein
VSSFANVSAFDTDDGLVLVDTGSFVLAEPTRARLRGITKRPGQHRRSGRTATSITCFGVDLYERDSGRHVRVIAHEAVTRRFERYRADARVEHGDQPAPVPDQRPSSRASSAHPTRRISAR